MKQELDDALCRDFPLTFRDRHERMDRTAMCWGFQCGDGWEPIIRRASAKIEAVLQALPEKMQSRMKMTTVKEKFGTLRMYFTYTHPDINAIIEDAETESETTCERCGAPGELSTEGWWVVQCVACSEKTAPEE